MDGQHPYILYPDSRTKIRGRCVPIPDDGQPNLPPERSLFSGRERLGSVGPERPKARRPDLPDRVNQSPVIAGTTNAVSPLRQVVTDETLEVIELAVGYEDCGQGSIFLMTDVQQLNPGTLACQAFKS